MASKGIVATIASLSSAPSATVLRAQEFIINDVSIYKGNGSYFDGKVEAGGYLQVIVNASSTTTFGSYAKHPGTCELWMSSNSAAINTIVDVIGVNVDFDASYCSYEIPKSLTQGQYYVRVYVSGEASTRTSNTFSIVGPILPFECTVPPPYKHITSTSDPNFTSLRLKRPEAGDVIYLPPRIVTSLAVEWFYVDTRNYRNTAISDLQLEAVSENTTEVVHLGTAPMATGTIFSYDIGIASLPITPGAWRVRANYTNTFEHSGSIVSALSEVFYVVESNSSCQGFAIPTSSSDNMGAHKWAMYFCIFTAVFLCPCY